jgi:hypothetical protein
MPDPVVQLNDNQAQYYNKHLIGKLAITTKK